ncbi:hypothetical protein D3C83_173030 [compost metagenome]
MIELRKALATDRDSIKELAAVAGHEGEVPFSESVAIRRAQNVTYKPSRRGARYRR